MSTLLNYGIPGIPYGCDFALMAVGLVLTFRATGVFNLAFGAQAFLAAFVFDVLVRSAHIPVGASFVLSVLVLSPAIGLALDRFLYRYIPTASMTAKVVSSLGLLIAIPVLMPIIFGSAPRLNPPNLWLNPNHVYFHLFTTPINGGEISTTVIVVVVVAAVMAMFRWTGIGLDMRAVVESRRMSQLEGINAPRVAAGAWALSSALAGLAGVLLIPLTPEISAVDALQFTSLLVAGLTAAAVASMRSLPIALGTAVGLGIVENLLRGYLPSGGVLAQIVIPAFPFIVLIGTLLLNPGLRKLDLSHDPLASCDPPPAPRAITIRDRRLDRPTQVGFWVLVVAFLVSSATWVPGYWVTSFSEGLTLSIVFLSVTLMTGMSGQLSLCQATFAGVGAFAAGQFANHLGLSVLVGAVVGGLLAAAAGAIVALVAIRVSGLLLALVTLSFALLADQQLFYYSWSGGGLEGVNLPRPVLGPFDFGSDRSFLLLCFVALVVCTVLVMMVQRGTVGRYLAAMRGSPTAAASLGISLRTARLTVFAMSAGLAGFGGALFGSVVHNVAATSFPYEISLVWVVVVITTGSQTVEGAIQAGIGYTVIQTLFTLYLPPRIQGLTPILFAVGAMTYAAHPEGVVEYQKSRWLARVSRLLRAYDARRAPAARHRQAVPVLGPVSPRRSRRRYRERASVPDLGPDPKFASLDAQARPGPERRNGTAPLLDARDISVRFGGIAALKDVSVTVGPGEAVGLVGPNGAGKTTLFNCLCGQLRNSSGTVTFDGHSLDGMPAHLRARLGIRRTFQRVEVFPELTVRDHLIVAERARRGDGALWKDLLNMGQPKKDELEHVDEILELVGLSDLALVPVAALSLGHCRLVELGRALAGAPRLLMADEPSSGLDIAETVALTSVLRTVQREHNMAVLLVEHDMEMVRMAVDRVIVLDVGAVIAEGTFDAVVANPEVRRAYLGRSA